MKKVMNSLMLSCKKATELIEKRNIQSLSFIEKIQMILHLSMCTVCNSYKSKSQIIEAMIEKWAQTGVQEKTSALPEASKNELLEKFKNLK